MCSTPFTACLGMLLSLALLACQPANPIEQDLSATNSRADPATDYLFVGNPGIATNMRDDITGTMTGTVGGQSIAFGPDQAIPVVTSTSYNAQTLKATTLNISA